MIASRRHNRCPLPRLRVGLRLTAAALLMSFLVALAPLKVDAENAMTFNENNPYHFVNLQKSKAYAETPEPGDYPQADLSFLEYLANSAGVTNASDLVTTTNGIISVSTGINIVKATGSFFGSSLSQSLSSLTDAADYPPFEDLTSEQQQAWGNVENYNASKFNSLIDGFGFGEARTRWKEGFTGSGGGSDFDWTVEEREKLDTFGRIANRWISGIGNTVGDLLDFFSSSKKQDVLNWLPKNEITYKVDGTGKSDWPHPPIPWVVYLGQGSVFEVHYTRNDDTERIFRYEWSQTVYMMMTVSPASTEGNTDITVYGFSKTPYQYRQTKPATSSWSNASSQTKHGESFYINQTQVPNATTYYATLRENQATRKMSYTEQAQAGYYILFGESEEEGEAAAEEVEDYPQDINDDNNKNQKTWIPAIGITPGMTWPDLTTPNLPQSPENPYNPDNETDLPEWENDTSTNLLHLGDVKWNKLFPFCLLYDVQLLHQKLSSAVVDDGQSYSEIVLPFGYGGEEDEQMVLDITPLHDLALMVRPFMQILLCVALLMVTVFFWRNVLTGS